MGNPQGRKLATLSKPKLLYIPLPQTLPHRRCPTRQDWGRRTCTVRGIHHSTSKYCPAHTVIGSLKPLAKPRAHQSCKAMLESSYQLPLPTKHDLICRCQQPSAQPTGVKPSTHNALLPATCSECAVQTNDRLLLLYIKSKPNSAAVCQTCCRPLNGSIQAQLQGWHKGLQSKASTPPSRSALLHNGIRSCEDPHTSTLLHNHCCGCS